MIEENKIIIQHLNDDVRQLAFSDKWCNGYDKTYLINQIQARQKAKSKLPDWYADPQLIFPPALSVEQASSTLTSRYKASLVSGNSLIDLTAGMGADSLAFSEKIIRVTAFEQNKSLAEITKHNLQKLAGNVRVISGDGIFLLQSKKRVDWIYVDPARRKEGGKVFLLQDCEPDLTKIMPLLEEKAENIMMKLSPLLDLSLLRKEIHTIAAIHIVSVHNEVKEILAIVYPKEEEKGGLFCVNLEAGKAVAKFAFSLDDTKDEAKYTNTVKKYLYEPHPTILKAGVMNRQSNQFSLEKLHPNSHLYTSDHPKYTYFGRMFEVISVFSLNKHGLKNQLAGISQAHITIRNFPIQEKALRKRLHLNEGGDIYIFATTLLAGEKVLIKCRKKQIN